MIQIRSNVFETNSSSSHSLVVLKEDKPLEGMIDPQYYVTDEGRMYLYDYDMEFGRSPFNILTNWYHRMCYAFASFANDDITRDHIIDILYKRIAGLREIIFPKNPWYDDETDDEEQKFCYGYVDHQSMGLLSNFLLEHDVSLEDFIFNDRYLVIIDGDEYRIFDTIQQLPFWNGNGVEEIVNA